MSLAGKLSDLSLPELLQLVAMSRKTGALEICSEQGGAAWLGMRGGSIVRVALEHGDLEREPILKRAGLSSDSPSDVVEAALWGAAVQAILGIFEWTEAEFTFEPLDDPALQWRGPPGILLPSPLSSDFLALEGARLLDESASAAAAARSVVSDAAPTDVFPMPAPIAVPRPAALICVDADLALLERLKHGLQAAGTRIHIFQSATDALQRFRQYLAGGETPALIVGSMVEDPFEAHKELGWRRFAGRVLGIAPRVRVIVVARSGERVAAPGIAVVCRPDPHNASDQEYQAFVAAVERARATYA
jgi:hypothetical protein